MTTVTIIGIGSPQGADQVGWRAVESLKKDHALQTLMGDGAKYLILDRPGMALLDYLAGTDYAMLIDAVVGGTAGRVIELGMDDLQNNSTDFSIHSTGVAEALAMGRVLNNLPQKLEILGIEVGDLSCDDAIELIHFKHLRQLAFERIESYFNSQ